LIVRVFHLATSQLVFGTMLLLAVRAFQVSRPGAPAPIAPVRAPARRALALAAGFVYVQLLLGALVRHTGSGMACTTAFLCDGSAWPGFGPGEIQMLHRYFALLTSGVVIWATVRALPELKRAESRLPRRLAIAAHILILLQISLGIGTVQSTLAVPVATAHLGMGALLWGDLVLLWAFTGAPRLMARVAPKLAGLSTQAAAS
jgi:cytochrome c oxidase assembly protein subunit 15